MRFFLIFITQYGCENKTSIDTNNIVAIVADDTIYTNDLITRAEYNIRPIYCDGKSKFDKHIILNSIIAEKLFALESVEKQTVPKDNEMFKARLKGIKHQAMREELLYNEVNSKVIVSQDEIEQTYINSKKTIDAVAVFIPNGFNADAIYKDAKSGISFDELSKKYIGISKPKKKEIKWDNIDKASHDAIFNSTVTKGTILKPIAAKGGKRLIKVITWKEDIELSPGNVQKQMELIKGKLERRYIEEGTKKYIANIMSGVELKFNSESWNYISNYLKPIYVNNKKDNLPIIELDKLYKELNANTNQPFIYYGDNVLFVEDFIDLVKVHPLGIKTKNITNKNFGYRLRAAIAALVIDVQLNKIAYSRNYDKLNVVNRTVKSWETYVGFLSQRDTILAKGGYKGNIKKDYFDAFDNYLTPHFDSLKIKYNSRISLNKAVLAQVELSSVQMFTHKTRGPYLNVTPPFPIATNSAKINYKLIETIN